MEEEEEEHLQKLDRGVLQLSEDQGPEDWALGVFAVQGPERPGKTRADDWVDEAGRFTDCDGFTFNAVESDDDIPNLSWVGDGTYCDDPGHEDYYGINLNCVKFNYDNGDCLPPPPTIVLSIEIFAPLSELLNLEFVDLSSNYVTGTLPPDWKSWANIEEVNIEENQLTGSFPPEYESWKWIFDFRANANRFSGVLPPDWKSWSNVETFSVNENELSGTFPPSYKKWKAVGDLYADSDF